MTTAALLLSSPAHSSPVVRVGGGGGAAHKDTDEEQEEDEDHIVPRVGCYGNRPEFGIMRLEMRDPGAIAAATAWSLVVLVAGGGGRW